MTRCGWGSVSIFKECFASVGGIFFLGGTGRWVIIPWGIDIGLDFPNCLRIYVRNCLETREANCKYQFISSNQASFRLWWKENLGKHQKFSIFWPQNYLLNFMSLLTVPIVKNSHILAGIYFIFLKERPRFGIPKALQYQIWTSKKSSYHVRNFSSFLQLRCSNFRLKLC